MSGARLLAATMAALLGVVMLAGRARAQDSHPGYGTALGDRSKIQTTLKRQGDVDDYVFHGYPGMAVRVRLRVEGVPDSSMTFDLHRPDGTVVREFDGAVFTTTQGDTRAVDRVDTIRFVLDQRGTWRVRVRDPRSWHPDVQDKQYQLALRLSRARRARADDAPPAFAHDGVVRHAYRIPAEGGATLSFRFHSARRDVEFGSLRAPDGSLVPLAGALRLRDRRDSRWFIARRVRLADELPRGDYELSFDVPNAPLESSRFRWKVKPPKRDGRLRGALDADEPEITDGPQPAIGVPGTRCSVTVLHAFDANDPDGTPTLLFGDRAAEDVQAEPGDEDGSTVLAGTVPADIAAGTHDVVVRTSRGQVAVATDAFTVPRAPEVVGVTPDVGSPTGGFPITVTGSGFRSGGVEILVDGSAEPVTFLLTTEGTLRFVAPPHAAGPVTFAVRDVDSGRTAALPSGSFTYEEGPVIATVAPGLTPILGGDTIRLSGFQFAETDRVFLESSTPGEFEEITATQSTYRDDTSHEFVAPVRPAGRYEVCIQAESDDRSARSSFLDYFQLSDFTDRLALEAPAPDDLHDGWTTDLADFDGDGDQDLFLARRGSGPRQETSQLALFENDGSGSLTDVTALRIQAPSAGDDWRADRIRAVDVTRDGRPDIVLATNDLDVPGPTLSHTRILANEQRSEASGPDDRVFRDRTLDLFAPRRTNSSSAGRSQDDNWRGLDLWVGDLDGDGDEAPEIVITHDEATEELNVFCGNYCKTSTVGGYSYSFYWGGTRAFVWDEQLRGGMGRFRFEHRTFPRRSGITVPIINPPPGIVIPTCTANQCRGTFTPFTGHTLRVRDIDGDGRRDVVVISDQPVLVKELETSSTQVALYGYDKVTKSLMIDVTPQLAALGGDTTGDAGAIAFLDASDDSGVRHGTIVIAKRDAPSDGGNALRLIRYVPAPTAGDPGTFEDITEDVLPDPLGEDVWQAAAVHALDVDREGRDDLVLLADAAPQSGSAALRILRAHGDGSETMLADDLRDLFARLTLGDDQFDGHALAIGDLDGDGAPEYVMTRAVPTSTGTQTRAIATDR